MMKSLRDVISGADLAKTLAYAVVGGKRRSDAECSRVRIVPREVKGALRFQAEEQRGTKAFHVNIAPEELQERLTAYMADFRHLTLFTDGADIQVAVEDDGSCRVSEGPATKSRLVSAHDRAKAYILKDGTAEPYLVDLGVMDSSGRVRKERYAKFRQINRYLEFIRDMLPHLPPADPLRVVDFGSGKAYLTFALHSFLSRERSGGVEIVGLDLKDDVVSFCESVARRLDCAGLRFERGDIAGYGAGTGRPNLIVSLHACDTATDEALAKGIQWGCEAIMAVPCCQHEFAPLLRNAEMAPLLRHGVSKDKLATLITDTSRVLMLEAFGYKTDLVEFIDTEHTSKNVLIRAHTRQRAFDPGAYRAYRAFLDAWGIGRTYLEDSLAAKDLLRAGTAHGSR